MSARAAADAIFDYCCAPSISRWRDELSNIRKCLEADWQHLRKHKSIFRRRPEKGVVRIVLMFNWLFLHLYALIVLAAYGTFAQGLHGAVLWWFVSTGLAGFMYVGLMYSDPGFMDKEMLVRLTENLKLGVDVVASDYGRGLLQDVAGDVPAMQELVPAANPDDPEVGGGGGASSSTSTSGPAGAGGDSQASEDLLHPPRAPLTAKERQEKWEKQQRKERNRELAHAKAYFAQRPQDWSEYGTLKVPGAEQEGGEGKENGAAGAIANADTIEIELSEVPNQPQPDQQQPGSVAGGKANGKAKALPEAAASAAAGGDAEITLALADDAVTEEESSSSSVAVAAVVASATAGGKSAAAAPAAAAKPSKGRAKVLPTGGGDESSEEDDAEELANNLARNPRIVGYDEEGEAEAMEEARKLAEWRKQQPLGVADFFSGYCDEADMYLPIRAKYCKKHGKVIAKFDHYCYAVGTSIGELNHGRFYRLLCMQVLSIWMGEWLLSHSYLSFRTTLVWTVANTPLLIMNLITWIVGIPLSILLCIHTFMALTSSTTYEFVKLETLEYMNGFYPFSFPFSDGLFGNIRHFCCPRAIKLWRRAPPESEWEDTFWRNKYYSCCG